MGYIDTDKLYTQFDTLMEGGLSVTISLAEYRFLTQRVTTLELDNDRLRSDAYRAGADRDEAKKAQAAAEDEARAQIAARNRMNKLLELHHGLVYDPLVDAYVSKNKPTHTGQSGLRKMTPVEIAERDLRFVCEAPPKEEDDE